MSPTDVALRRVPLAVLQSIAAGEAARGLELPALHDSLPPQFVAQRALTHLNAGKSAHWCSTFHIVRAGMIVGGCGFKDEPRAGAVEFGYAVAPEARNQGIGRAALAQLLAIAFASPHVTRVHAQISPQNSSSLRVVEQLGFVIGAGAHDADGEWVLQCVLHRLAQPGSRSN